MTDKLPDHAALVAKVWRFGKGANVTTPWIALLAVLELHRPRHEGYYFDTVCAACSSDEGKHWAPWPCQTYVALATPFIGLVP